MRARHAALLSASAVALIALAAIQFPTTMGTVGVLAFFLIVVIGLHELGHFVFAKRAGMKVTEFFIGFGPRLWSVQRGETEYGIKALPLGGYCKIIGMTNLEETDPEDEDRTFRSKGFWAKTTTLLAGPATHFVLALVMVWAVTAFRGDVLLQSHTKVTTVLDRVERGSPADRAGLRAGDRVLSLDHQRVATWEQVSKLIRGTGGRSIEIVVDRGPRQYTARAVPAKVTPDGRSVGYLGVTPSLHFDRPGVFAAAVAAPAITWALTQDTAAGFAHVFSPSGMSDYISNFTNSGSKKADPKKVDAAQKARFVSLVGVGQAAHSAVEAGWVTVLGLLILINLSVGLINLLPLIPFDGGHIAVAVYEAIMSRIHRRKYRVDFAKLMPVAVATLAFFAFIFLSSMFLDITKPA